MDEVPIPNNNPVIFKPKKEEPKTKPKKYSRLLDTFINFIFMFPLACIISYQLYLLGYRFGEFITFPPTSVITYIFIGSILLMLLTIQIMMRSIIYSIMDGIFFLTGIFNAWFGPIYDPIVNNFSGIVEIVNSAMTRKDVPFQLLVTGGMSGIYLAVIFIQFLTSLFVKSFFEMVFGKKWGDGRWMGYVGAIALIFGIYISFNSYHKYANDNKEKLIGKYFQQYIPMEKFITRTPGNVTYNEKYVWVNNGENLVAVSLDDGKVVETVKIKSIAICKDIQKADYPVVASERKFVAYSADLSGEIWETVYPLKKDLIEKNSVASSTEKVEEKVEEKAEENSNEDVVIKPLTLKFIGNGKYMLSIYEGGYFGLIDVNTGDELWCEKLDQPTKISKIQPNQFLDDISYLINKNKLILACQNGIVKSVDLKTGKTDWTYNHTVAKVGGKAQKGILSANGDNNFIASFKTGEIVTLSYKDGHIIHKAVNEIFVANNPVWCNERKCNFITDEGLYYEIELEGGKIVNRINALPNKAEFYPILQNNQHCIYAHRDNLYHVTPDRTNAKLIFNSKNRTFITKPVFADKVMYIGTQDGYVYCIHYGSESVKWVGHVDGELMEDSLAINNDKLIVKTKSDSVFIYKKDFIQ